MQRTLVGPGLPAWSAAFLPDNRTLLTGGSDHLVRRWNALTGERIGETDRGNPGRSAGRLRERSRRPGVPRLRRVPHPEGRRAAPRGADAGRHLRPQDRDAPGYDFSPALKKLDIVWTPETVSKLFEIGPAAYTPGTKMPEQRVGAEDRAALVKFLEKATQP